MTCRAVPLPGDGSRDAQLSAQLLRRMRCKRVFADLTAALKLNVNELPVFTNRRAGADKLTRHLHTKKRQRPLLPPTPRAAPARRDNQNGIRFGNILQPKSGIELCTVNAPLKVRSLLLHVVGHSDEPCRTGAQARGPFDLFPIGRTAAALARQIHNFHASASYSVRAFKRGIRGRVMAETYWNVGGTT